VIENDGLTTFGGDVMKTIRMWMTMVAVLSLSLWGARTAHAWCNPINVECGTVISTNLHSGQTHDDIQLYNCTDTTRWRGNAHVYRIDSTLAGDTLCVSLEWNNGADWRYDLGILILSDCNENHCIAADAHQLCIPTEAGQDYWIIVDGRRDQADTQSYILSIFCEDIPLSAELTAFDALTQDAGVRLSWSVASETNNSYFELSRSAGENEAWETLAQVEGRGTATSTATYTFDDHNVQRGVSYTYRLTAVDFDGSRHELGLTTANVGISTALVGEFRLLGNYPNPFNPSTRIRFEIAEAGVYTLEVFSVTGSLLATLSDGALESGYHEVEFTGSELGSGVYFARLTGAAGSQMMKMILLK
jgi:hypothetical protein